MSATDRLTAALARHAGRPCLIAAADGRELTYADAQERASALAAALRDRGLRPGDRLAVSLPNCIELPLIYLAALMSGLIVVPLGSGFGRRELRDIVGRARPGLALAGGPGPNEALDAVAADAAVPLETLSAGGAAGTLDLWQLQAATPTGFESTTDDALASIHFTSGSTGTPRGVAHRLRDFVDNAGRYAAVTGLDESCRFHHTLPMTYMAGYYNLLLLPITIGASVVIDRAFDARSILQFWNAPRTHEANVLWLVPTILAMLLKVDRGEEGRAFCREHVRHLACGTAPLPPELRATFEREYGVAVHDSYGLSETLLATASHGDSPATTAGVGPALPGVEIRIAAAAGAPGAICIRSQDTMVGYVEGTDEHGSLRTSSPVDADGWLDTGDIGMLDGEGALHITGREKDIIIRGGVNVSSVEVEKALEGETGAERLAVVGVPHEILGEQLAVVVATAAGKQFDDLEVRLKARAVDALEAGRRPDLYVHIDEMPTTPTGKVRKGALRDMVIDVLGLPPAAKGFKVDAPEARMALAPSPWSRVIDLTHPIFEGMVSFPSPNHPTPEVTVLARHEEQGRLVLGSHTGTHADAPLHFIPGGQAIDSIELERLIGPAHVADLSGTPPLTEVSRDQLQAALGGPPGHPRVLLRFDWASRFVDLDFYSESPYLSEEACRWLVSEGVDVLGMDTPSPDDPRQGQDSGADSPNHHVLLGAGVVMLEYLANLDQLPASEVFLVALPLLVSGADGTPMRVVALA
jgi:acyl-CoA synthetase (AMP-forming)/AMP-acid ligase II/kynurenine formamidase